MLRRVGGGGQDILCGGISVEDFRKDEGGRSLISFVADFRCDGCASYRHNRLPAYRDYHNTERCEGLPSALLECREIGLVDASAAQLGILFNITTFRYFDAFTGEYRQASICRHATRGHKPSHLP